MADFTLPARPKRRQSQAPTLPISALPGRGEGSQSGVEGFLTRLPAGMGAGTPNYQAGLDQSRSGQLAAGLPEVQDQVATAQAQSLQEHKAYREGLQATQQQVDTRNKDLKLAENLLIATDPGTDKAVRKFMLAGISQAVGVDPKGEYSQSLQKMVLGMAPEGLEALRSSFTDDISNSPPGAIHAKLGAMFSGDIPVDNVIGQVKEHQEARAAAARGLTAPGVPLTSGTTPDIAGAETTAELAGGAGAAPAAALPAAAQRQQIIQAAGLSDAPTAQVPAETPPAPTDDIPDPTRLPDIPIEPVAEIPPSLSDAPTATEPPAAPVEVTPPPPAAPTPPPTDTAIAEQMGQPPAAAPTAATPPPDTGKITVTPEMRQAAEQAGDKLLIKALDLLEQRNAVLDSAAIHRGGPPPVAGAPPAAGKGSPSGASFFPSTQTLPYKGPPIDPNKPPPAAAERDPGVPATSEDAKRIIGKAAQTALEALPADPITGNKPSDVFKFDPDGREITSKSDDQASKQAARVLTNEAAPAGPSPGQSAPAWIAEANARARQGGLAPATPGLLPVEAKDRPPANQELLQGIRGRTPGLDPDPKVRYVGRDISAEFPNIENTPAGETRLATATEKRDKSLVPLYTTGARLTEILTTPDGAKLVGKTPFFMTPGEFAQKSEQLRHAIGWTDNSYGIAEKLYGKRAEEVVKSIRGLNSEQKAGLSREITSLYLQQEGAVALAMSPRGDINQKEREYAREIVGNPNLTPGELIALMKSNLDTSTKAANAGFASETGNSMVDFRNIPRETRDKIVEVHGRTVEAGKSPFNPEYVKNIMAINMQEDNRKAGKPPRENEYLITKGGDRPEMYEAAKLKHETTKEARLEAGEQRAQAGEVRAEKTSAREDERLAMAKEAVAESARRYEEGKARQRQQDAAHAQEKMAAAFQRIGQMIAGSVRGIGGGGGSGISAGGEDSSAFRIAPMPQRAAPRVAPATGITRYGGPIKKNQ